MVNGENHQLEKNLLLLQLLEILKFNPRLIALEYNGEILHRQYWDSTMVQDGDRLEVVTIVGGG
nr:sulfur carrier protein ThiS [Cyanobacterium stanieri]